MSVKLGIIGTGSAAGRLHLPALQKMPDSFQIAAVSNRTRAKAELFAKPIGTVKVYDDYRALLEDPEVEAVLTAVPVQVNAPILIDAIRADKHVMAEKPIAATLSEAREVLCYCKESRKVIAIAENFRYREDVIRAHEVIAGGEIGDVYCFQMVTRYDVLTNFRRPWFEKGTWRHDPSYPGGMISDTGVHVISSLHDILGEVKELYAQVLDTSSATKGPDTLLVQLTMSNGAVGHYLACYSAKVVDESVFDFTAFGKTGSLQLCEGNLAWLRRPGEPPLAYHPGWYDRGYTNQWRNFYSAIRGQEVLISTPEKAYRDLLVIDCALRSANCGEKVRINYHGDE